MRYTPRRRRDDEEQEGGGLPVIPLMIIVVFAGLLLGGLLAHFFGGAGSGAQEAMSPPAVTPVPGPTHGPKVAPLRRLTPSPTPRPSPSTSATRTHATPSPKPTPSATPATVSSATASATTAVQTPQPALSAAARPAPPVVTATPERPKSTPTPHAPATPHVAAATHTALPHAVPLRVGLGMQTESPVEVVRAYLDALARGDRSGASSYLASGAPAEPFMREGARIADITSASNGDGTYRVTADVRAKSGQYYITFTVAAMPQGTMVITDHFYIKPR